MAGYNLITDDSEALQAYLNNITHSTPLSLEEEKNVLILEIGRN